MYVKEGYEDRQSAALYAKMNAQLQVLVQNKDCLSLINILHAILMMIRTTHKDLYTR
jgi:hypothetical protein